jgi:hypothetical protein
MKVDCEAHAQHSACKTHARRVHEAHEAQVRRVRARRMQGACETHAYMPELPMRATRMPVKRMLEECMPGACRVHARRMHAGDRSAGDLKVASHAHARAA